MGFGRHGDVVIRAEALVTDDGVIEAPSYLLRSEREPVARAHHRAKTVP